MSDHITQFKPIKKQQPPKKQPMKKQYLLLSFIALALSACNQAPLVIKLSQEKLQKTIDKKFPYKKSALVAKIELTDPKLTLKNDQLLIDVSFNGSALTKSIEGQLNASGEVTYRPDKKAFYLKGFHIRRVDLANITGQQKDRVVNLLDKALNAYLTSFPVYRLKKTKYTQNLARMLLKDVKTEEGQLVVKLGF